jgi:hypothetical protein
MLLHRFWGVIPWMLEAAIIIDECLSIASPRSSRRPTDTNRSRCRMLSMAIGFVCHERNKEEDVESRLH